MLYLTSFCICASSHTPCALGRSRLVWVVHEPPRLTASEKKAARVPWLACSLPDTPQEARYWLDSTGIALSQTFNL